MPNAQQTGMVERAYMNHWIKGRKLRINDSSRLIAAPAHMVMIWGLEENELEEENKKAKNVSEKKTEYWKERDSLLVPEVERSLRMMLSVFFPLSELHHLEHMTSPTQELSKFSVQNEN